MLEAELTVNELKDKSVKYGFRIFDKESKVLLAIGYVVVVAANKKTGKSTQIPKEIVEKLRPFCK